MSVSNAAEADRKAGPYAWYVLVILFFVYALNFIDRQILTILAPHIRRDLGLSHADIGFLYGTAFGVFYALFGIPLGRLADSWHRVRLMTIGLALWSTMTAVSGLSRNGFQLAAARIGVGVGEATASPSAYSLISDWFPKRQRATALAIYSAGIYFGGGFSLFLGGAIVDWWNAAYPVDPPLRAGRLAGGVHGGRPARPRPRAPGADAARADAGPVGRADCAAAPRAVQELPRRPADDHPAAHLARRRPQRGQCVAAQPRRPRARRRGGLRADPLRRPEPLPQWLAVGIGVYAVYSWSAALRHRDAPTSRLILGTPAFLAVVLAYGLNAFLAYAVAGLAPSYAVQVFGITSREAGLWIGGPAILGGFLGVTLGGIAADRLRRRWASGRIMVILFGSLAPIPSLIIAFTTADKALFYAMLPITQVFASCALGAAAAATQDLVLPRMRGTATAAFFIGTTLIGLAMGPYLAGRVADLTGSLSTGILSLLVTLPLAVAAAIVALRLVPAAEASREARAREAGEPL